MNHAQIVLALSARALGVSAETYYSGQADSERRERNREEALANYRAGHSSVSAATHDAAAAMRHGTHEAAEATRHAAHEGANAARHAGHKTAKRRGMSATT